MEPQARYRRALVFTGHMVDLPARPHPRFPPRMEADASREIAAAMDRGRERVAAADVIAVSSLARGGDILFQEHAGACRLPSYVVLPFEPDVFLRKSVAGVPSAAKMSFRFCSLLISTSRVCSSVSRTE